MSFFYQEFFLKTAILTIVYDIFILVLQKVLNNYSVVLS